MPGLYRLGLDHQATFWIGQMARESVRMERLLISIGRKLQGEAAPQSSTGGFQRQARDVRMGLRGLTDFEFAAESEDAVAHAARSYRIRNRFVHDELASTFEESWHQIDLRKLDDGTPKLIDIDHLADCATDLRRAWWRLTAVDAVLSWQLMPDLASEPRAAQREGWLRILRNDFQVSAGGGASLGDPI